MISGNFGALIFRSLSRRAYRSGQHNGAPGINLKKLSIFPQTSIFLHEPHSEYKMYFFPDSRSKDQTLIWGLYFIFSF